MRSRLWPLLVLVLAWGFGRAQEAWSGNWAESAGHERGSLTFMLEANGLLTGSITNNGVTGSWHGLFLDDGTLLAYYQFPFYAANQALIRFTQRQGSVLTGQAYFWSEGRIIGTGKVTLERSAALGRPLAAWPFAGAGRFVYCAAGAGCPRRTPADIPGDWGGFLTALRQGGLAAKP